MVRLVYTIPDGAHVSVDDIIGVMERYEQYGAATSLDEDKRRVGVTMTVDAVSGSDASRRVLGLMADDPLGKRLSIIGIDTGTVDPTGPLPAHPPRGKADIWFGIGSLVLTFIGVLLTLGGESTVLLALGTGIAAFALAFIGVVRARRNDSIPQLITGTVAMTLSIVLTILTGASTLLVALLTL